MPQSNLLSDWLGGVHLLSKRHAIFATIAALILANSSSAESGDIFQLGTLYACVVEGSNTAVVGKSTPDRSTNHVMSTANGIGKSFSIYRAICEITGPTSLDCLGDLTNGIEFLIVQDETNEFSGAFQKVREGYYRGHADFIGILVDGSKVTYIKPIIGADENGIDAVIWVERTRCYPIGTSPYKPN